VAIIIHALGDIASSITNPGGYFAMPEQRPIERPAVMAMKAEIRPNIFQRAYTSVLRWLGI